MNVKLTVVCVTYNHEKYIAQALDGIVKQKTNFSFEVLVGDDASTDKTQDIIRQYAEKYPGIVKPILRKKNIGAAANSFDLYSRVKTLYVAICDGDDYWVDEYKLQKQVDFLDEHPDYTVCFHPVKVVREDKRKEDILYPTKKMLKKIKSFDIDALLKCNFIQTVSVVYRWAFNNVMLSKEFVSLAPGDWFLAIEHAKKGKIGFIDEVMAIYRRHESGVWSAQNLDLSENFYKMGRLQLAFYQNIMRNFDGFVSEYATGMVKDALMVAALKKDKEILYCLADEYFDLFCAAQLFNKVKEKNFLLKKIRCKFVNFIAKLLNLPIPYDK